MKERRGETPNGIRISLGQPEMDSRPSEIQFKQGKEKRRASRCCIRHIVFSLIAARD